jgi:DNA-binding transcriptional regulator LsrR (DeoR family)
MMPTVDDATRKRLLETVEHIDTAETSLTQARLELRDVLRQAHSQGVSISALARQLGLSRTRVRQLLEE